MTRAAAAARAAGGRAPGTAGFTLIEMLVALLILALVAGIGVAGLARRDPGPGPAAARLQAVLTAARSDAIRTGRDTAVLVDAARARFAYPPEAPFSELAPGLRLSMTTPSAGRAGHVDFRPDGSSPGAEIAISNARGAAALIEVGWLTGLPRRAAGTGR